MAPPRLPAYEPLSTSPAPGTSPARLGCLGRAAAAAAVGILGAAFLVLARPWRLAATAAGPAAVVELSEGGVGGCAWGVHCDKVPCCSEAGYACVHKTKWWSACERQHDADAAAADTIATTLAPAGDVLPVPPAAAVPLVPATETEEQKAKACAGAGEDCTESKCCRGHGYACKKRTDGMWWKSSCIESAATATSAPAVAAPAAPAPAAPAVPAPAAPAAPALGPPLPAAGGVVRGEACGAQIPETQDPSEKWDLAEQCSRRLLAQLSLEDKLGLLHGQDGGMGYAGYIKVQGAEGSAGPVRLTFNDGPQGYNGYAKPTWSKGTQFPDLIAVAASFDLVTAARMGQAVAEEFRTKGCSVLLGPDVEVVRTQMSGRTFESLSGEDPYLGSELARAYVREVQKRGIISTVKHWLDNNQELDRQEVDVRVGARAQHEIYMQPFQGAIEAGAGAVMCSYNKVDGEYACGNRKLLRETLRKDLGFRGFVVSDWGAVHEGAAAASGGLNVEMPEAKHFKNLGTELPAETVDELAGQVLAAAYAAGHFHGRGPPMAWKWPPPYYQDATSEEHDEVARSAIIASAVLLKNAHQTLPLAKAGLRVTMVGSPCHSAKRGGGQGDAYASGGSGYVATARSVTPLEGLRAKLGPASVSFSEDGTGVKAGDVAVVCAAVHTEEGSDRETLELPHAKELIAAANSRGAKRTVLVAIVPGAVTTEWIGDVDAVLVLFMPGEQVGNALAKLLTAEAGPAGRLPVSFPSAGERRFEEAQYPGVGKVSSFSEGVLVGYRWNDAKGVRSAFPFGFGLSYTDFRFSNFSASCAGRAAKVSLTVGNMGAREGDAVPQLYVSYKSLLPVVRQLRGFRKVHIPAGFQAFVTFELSEQDWSFYDEEKGAWASALDLGEEVTVGVGSSSADVYWRGTLRCKGGTAV